MRINKKTLIVIGFLAFLAIILLFLTNGQKEKTLPLPPQTETIIPTRTIVSPSPTPSSPCPLNKNIGAELPVITKSYTIEYLPVSQKFFVMILGKPFEKYRTEAEKWFTIYGIDAKSSCVSWASPKNP